MKEKNEKIALSIFVVSLLALLTVLLVTFSQGESLTGKAVTEIEEKVSQVATQTQPSCTDADNGKNYNVKGTLDYCNNDGNCFTKEDFCSGNKVIEWYCENSESRYEEYECDSCDSGVCVALATNFKYAGGGGGGEGDSTTTTTTTTTTAAETFNTYELGALTSEQTLELAKNEKIKFTLVSANYILTLTNIAETQITLSSNSGQTFTLTVGEEQNLDLNSDGAADIYARLRSSSIITNKIKLTLGPL